ncbi:hypothetical protein C8J56DRAFT_1062335 [Mycena floridula]|nr:hypothetical protein C8J56DRAFT_1062335 [Mycena floridula]
MSSTTSRAGGLLSDTSTTSSVHAEVHDKWQPRTRSLARILGPTTTEDLEEVYIHLSGPFYRHAYRQGCWDAFTEHFLKVWWLRFPWGPEKVSSIGLTREQQVRLRNTGVIQNIACYSLTAESQAERRKAEHKAGDVVGPTFAQMSFVNVTWDEFQEAIAWVETHIAVKFPLA